MLEKNQSMRNPYCASSFSFRWCLMCSTNERYFLSSFCFLLFCFHFFSVLISFRFISFICCRVSTFCMIILEFNSLNIGILQRSKSFALQNVENIKRRREMKLLVPSDGKEMSKMKRNETKNPKHKLMKWKKKEEIECILFHSSAITWSHSQNTKCTLLLIIVLLVR